MPLVREARSGALPSGVRPLAECARILLQMNERAGEVEIVEREHDRRAMSFGDINEVRREAEKVLDVDDIGRCLEQSNLEQLVQAVTVGSELLEIENPPSKAEDGDTVWQLLSGDTGLGWSRAVPPGDDSDIVAIFL
jgi:hypothetical protein